MRDVNKVILIGRLGADPVQRQTHGGVAVVHFPLATSRRVKQEGEEAATTEETQWHRVVAWGRQGETCARYLKKGNSVYVEGSVRTRKFEGKEGGERFAFEIHADNVSFLGRSGRVKLEEAGEEPALEQSVAH